ncbi:MAG TPA: hypothetical protein VEU55_01425 [Gemmatimonadales bacterium]|nr:hypothetical protein [Gemmatimonadales bacterium]
MTRHRRYWRVKGLTLGIAGAAIVAACSNSTSPVATPCPTYKGGNATPAALQGSYTLVSFCQDTLPAFGPPVVTGTLVMTVGTPDSFQATINIPNQAPVVLAGPYTVSHDTITVTLPPPLGQFVGTYAWAVHGASDTLSVSGNIPGPIAIVFGK